MSGAADLKRIRVLPPAHSESIRGHSANTVDEQFTLGPLLDLAHLSSSLLVVGTCNSTFSASAGVVGASRRSRVKRHRSPCLPASH